ncbi:MAG: M1 family aminopeptidase [Bacteroidales bacterium]|nr:M1 family aminopeptidase [Bacteroidales bacterium]MDT8374830.1 M1 family aminopeptidase [Bacteroidales bacterium]
MKRKLKICLLPVYLLRVATPVLAILALSSCGRADRTEYTAPGVSKLLATYRYETLKDVRYNLSFRIDTGRTSPVEGTAVIEFERTSGREPLVIDFNVPADHLRSVSVNGRQAEAALTNGHIVIDRSLLSKSYNRVEVGFRAGDLSLNRNDEYLYTLFVPDRASTAFPCFDQPDIKGRFMLALDIPESYRAMSNNPVVSADTSAGRVTLRFSETKPISTYLFAFAAGRFELIEKEIDGVKMEMLHRESRQGYVDKNSDEIFRLHYSALKWLEEYTHIPYPFDKFGFVLLPPFQYSGMEHPGSIFYRASSLMLEASPTLNEQLSRASLIAHETSHIWFGDLVTMKWFDDVWLKEVFAGYMSDKIVTPDFPSVNHELRFLLSRYPAAYNVDRTRGTNPVIQELGNMKDAGSLYGAIIYNKAPIVMRQLGQLAGEEKLREALQIYLKEYSFGNARWDDLIAIIEKVTRKPLEEWSRMWFREAGMPLITPAVSSGEENADVSYRISFREDDPAGNLRHWPQTLQAMVITASDTVTGEVTPADKRSFLTTSGEPYCIIPDISGRAYGTFLFDSTTAAYLPDHINDFQDPLLRGILWINMHENLLNGTVSPTPYYNTLFTALQTEEELQLRNYLAGRLGYVYWHHLSDSARTANAPDAEAMIWKKLIAAETASEKRQWFVLFRNVAVTERGLARLRDLWKSGQLPGGAVTDRLGAGPVRLGEDELSGLALTLALRGHPEAPAVIAAQRDRITTADRLQRFDFVLPSVSPDQAVRDDFFNSLRDPASREHEPWVLEALGYLHHPSAAYRSEHYILPSLQLLEEIKSTGDIFFPGGWITTTLAGHHSATVRETVERFLEERPDYPADLRLKILQAADHLFRE